MVDVAFEFYLRMLLSGESEELRRTALRASLVGDLFPGTYRVGFRRWEFVGDDRFCEAG